MTDPTPVVDAHHHLWSASEQEWTRELPELNRDFGFPDLAPQLDRAGVAGTILVETVGLPGETAQLLSLANDTEQVRGVVGWVDLTADDVADRVDVLRELPGGDFLVGLRHQVQGEADPRWLMRPDVLRGLAAVARAGLVFELLILNHQLPAAIELVKYLPEGRFVLAHLGKPSIALGEFEPWASQVRELSLYDNVSCKLSGMVTEASASWTVADLEPYAAHALDVFGPDRLMAGSDWPVCLLRAQYQEVWDVNRQLVNDLSELERSAVLGGTATGWYRL